MHALFIDMETSYRDFPVSRVADLVPSWLHVDLTEDGLLRHVSPELEPTDVVEMEDCTRLGMRRLVHDRRPNYCEVCVRAKDGFLVAWVPEDRDMKLFRRVEALKHPNIWALEFNGVGVYSWAGTTKIGR
jgi:hypothetical protein